MYRSHRGSLSLESSVLPALCTEAMEAHSALTAVCLQHCVQKCASCIMYRSHRGSLMCLLHCACLCLSPYGFCICASCIGPALCLSPYGFYICASCIVPAYLWYNTVPVGRAQLHSCTQGRSCRECIYTSASSGIYRGPKLSRIASKSILQCQTAYVFVMDFISLHF